MAGSTTTMVASQKLGTARKTTVVTRVTWSTVVFCLTAEITPVGTEIRKAATIAMKVISKVIGARRMISLVTGRPDRKDVPRSPVSSSPVYIRYCW